MWPNNYVREALSARGPQELKVAVVEVQIYDNIPRKTLARKLRLNNNKKKSPFYYAEDKKDYRRKN